MKNNCSSEFFKAKIKENFFYKQSSNKETLRVGLFSNIDCILSISGRFKDSGVLKWVKFMTLWNCLDKIMCHVR